MSSMDYWPQLQRALWICNTLLQVALLLLICVKKVFRWSPAFAVYIAARVTLSAGWVWFISQLPLELSGWASINAHYLLYALEAGVGVIGVFASAEICSRVFEDFPNARCTWRVWRLRILRILTTAVAILICNGVLNWFSWGSDHYSDFFRASEIVPVAGVSMILATLLICRSFRIAIPASEATWLFGFGLNFGLASLPMVASWAGSSWDTLLWLHIHGLYYLVILALWHFAILGHRRLRQES